MEDNLVDTDGDFVYDDGDFSGSDNDNPCGASGAEDCDDNCPTVANPTQPDFDGDGIPDACDPLPWINSVAELDGALYGPFNPLVPDNANRTLAVMSPPGGGGDLPLPFDPCPGPHELGPGERVEIFFADMPATVGGWVENDQGRRVARIRMSQETTDERGVRFSPRCHETYTLRLVTGPGFPGSASFGARARVAPAGSQNPFAATPGLFDPPVLPDDTDGDGLYDPIDNCPMDYDPSRADRDTDGVGDVCDNCPDLVNPGQEMVAFPTVRAVDRNTFAWDDATTYDWISGRLGALRESGLIDNVAGGKRKSGYTFDLTGTEKAADEDRFFLFRHTSPLPSRPCDSWGHEGLAAVLPTPCNDDSCCPEDELCHNGFCGQYRTLAVGRTGDGDGLVESSPAGIHCGLQCSSIYPTGTVVTLTAFPAGPADVFAGWSGACSGTGTCTVTMDAERSVTAVFTRATRVLTVSKAGSGSGTVTSSPGGISCGSTCSASYPHGTSVTLTASPSGSGNTFGGFSGACTGTGTCTVTMSAARSVTATFSRVTYVLTVTRSGTGAGAVSSSPAGISCGTDCAESYVSGTVVTLTATISGRTAFIGWTGACTGTGTCTVTMSGARAVNAIFRAL